MHNKSFVLAAIAAATLCGCVSLPPYFAPPAGEQTAIVDTSRVKPTAICTNGTLYSVSAPRDNRLVVPTNTRVALYSFVQLADYNVTYTCNPGISFKPANGVSYLLNLEIEDQKCRMEVYKQGGSNRTGLDVEASVGAAQYCQATNVTAEMQKQSATFLDGASQKPGAVMLPSGVRYVVLEAGAGNKPEADSTVEIDVRGETSTGRLFVDSSASAKPVRFKVADFPLAGLREALVLMPVGSRWEVYLPPEQAFGDASNSPVGPGQAVKFTVRLKSAE